MTAPPTTRRPVLLTVSGSIDPALRHAIAEGRRPRADYFVLADALDADLLDVTKAHRTAGRLDRVIAKVAGNAVALAWACHRRRKRYDVVLTDSEQTGLPYAALTRLAGRRPRHAMIGHRLSAGKKVLVLRALRLRSRIDHLLLYASSQVRFAVEQLGFDVRSVTLTSFMVDTAFWRPSGLTIPARSRPMICAAGLELRDYPTLMSAVSDLDIDVVIAAASPWSKRPDTSAAAEIPANVEVRRLDHFELRQLYAEATLVVVPLQETDFQAGITSILEGMAMERPVICSLTAGQTDTIIGDVNGLYVRPGDPTALRAAITRLLDDPAEAARLAAAGREWVCANADIEVYARRLATAITPAG